MKAKKHTTSIQEKIFFSICKILIITLLLVGFFSVIVIKNYAKKTTINHSNELLQITSQNMNQIIDSIDNTSKQIALNQQIVDYCKNAGNMSEYDRIVFDMQLKSNLVNNILYSNTLISNIIVYPLKGNSLNWGEAQSAADSNFIKTSKNYLLPTDITSPYWLSTHQIKGAYKLKDIVSFIRPIFTMDNIQVGVLELQIPTEEFSTNLIEFDNNNNSGILTLDNDGYLALLSSTHLEETESLFLAAQEQLTQKKEAAYITINTTKFILNSTILTNGWTLVYYQPAQNLTQAADIVIFIILTAGICMMTIMIFISKNISQQLVQPIKDVISTTRNMDAIISPAGTENEIIALFNNYNFMMRRIHESELNTLRAQISPHFLYNTLNSIKCRAIIDGNKTVGSMIQWLINLLELSINNHNDYVSIDEEFQMLQSYVGLQKMRSDRQFTFFASVETPELGKCLIPKMILQTLVENSLLHGFDSTSENAQISVIATQKESFLIIEVTDNGIGISEEKIQEIMSANKETEKSHMNRIGLFNVDQRIKLYFGEKYGLVIKSALGKGTKVLITLPHITNWQKIRNDNND